MKEFAEKGKLETVGEPFEIKQSLKENTLRQCEALARSLAEPIETGQRVVPPFK